jgi:hypothetical protein
MPPFCGSPTAASTERGSDMARLITSLMAACLSTAASWFARRQSSTKD